MVGTIFVCIILAVVLLPVSGSALIHRLKAKNAWRRFNFQIFILEHKRAIWTVVYLILLIGIVVILLICQRNNNRESKQEAMSQRMAEETNETKEFDDLSDEESLYESSYELIVKDCTWDEAQELCILSGGNLLTIDSDEEFQTIINMIEENRLDNILFYVGAARDDDDTEYYWIDRDWYLVGESINVLNYWMDGEPSLIDKNLGLDENRVELFYYSRESRWVLNDIPNDLIDAMPTYIGRIGYICEYSNY